MLACQQHNMHRSRARAAKEVVEFMPGFDSPLEGRQQRRLPTEADLQAKVIGWTKMWGGEVKNA